METAENFEFETAEQFWQKLEDTVGQPCETAERIDDSLRSYIALTTGNSEYVETDADLRRCAYRLYSSPLFAQHADYIRTQLVHSLLQDDEADLLYITSTFLLADAREHDSTFSLLNNEGAFQRMVELIRAPREQGEEGLHRLLMELLYEMARIQKITDEELMLVDDNFISHLFGIIEKVSDDVTDPYHYPVIRVLLVLNEQYMVNAHHPIAAQNKKLPITNKIIKVLSSYGHKYKTFGENIILLLNREDETSLQLLTLKLLYLLFTTPSTYEYFYTNDLHVLVDILVRNLLDLPEKATALRHTYLRVLYPLLEHTQLKFPPHYKRKEIGELLTAMAGGHVDGVDEGVVRYFDDVDETTKRLVRRCQTVRWLDKVSPITRVESPVEVDTCAVMSPESPSKISKTPPALPAPRKLQKRHSSKSAEAAADLYLNPHLEARQSSLSMTEMVAQKEKPGVKTPSRNPALKHGLRGIVMQKKERPPPPKARRSAWRKDRIGALADETASIEMVDHPDLLSPPGQADIATANDDQLAQTNAPEIEVTSPQSKLPPPAPKARRWRGKRSKEMDENGNRPQEPGKFGVDLPSINTRIADHPIERSPFSPPPEETLSPVIETQDDHKPKHTSSVSTALTQAQRQAIQNIEETLEKAHIDVHHDSTRAIHHHHHHDDMNNAAVIEKESPTLQRTVLAPPGQAPIRGVPGPTMELEKSPFLSDNDSDDRIHTLAPPNSSSTATTNTQQEQRSRLPSIEAGTESEEESEDEWN